MTEHKHEHECEACSSNDPDYDLIQRMRDLVDEHGLGIIGVFPDKDHPESFWLSYTVGLTELGLPELAVTGMPSQPAQVLLMTLFDMIKKDVDSWRYFFVDGGGQRLISADRFIQDLEFEFVPINPTGNPPLGVACVIYGVDQVQAFQVMFPDDNYRLPSALEYNAKDFPQPILERLHGGH